ncbi:hypothetical protein BD324DRAFT_630374 [Kockovaella imperatae]|uniref:Uncharacterized protein n=1 Tax=Kockovaella imperatae TaxID=4999 RepID=A0A1Y1UDN0_9TREE|nr:hypothetical protein BD324DRAFT_630374 [Kockovaella imperatae]ORX36150.1 hypothetical protein BD324DRAFT_630374 [Kockovaella imperatae]
MFNRTTYWLCVLQLLCSAVSIHASPILNQHEDVTRTVKTECHTNAECLAAGLPLLKPSPRRLVHRAGGSGSVVTFPVVAYPAGSPGPNPQAVKRRSILAHRGKIAERAYGAPPAESLGYVKAGVATLGELIGTTDDPSEALYVTYDSTLISTTQNLELTDGGVVKYLCLASDDDEQDTADTTMSSSSTNDVRLTECASPGLPNSSPSDQTSARGNTAAEAAVWSVDSNTGLITATWTNPAGTSPASAPLGIMYNNNDPSGSSWYLTGAPADFTEELPYFSEGHFFVWFPESG